MTPFMLQVSDVLDLPVDVDVPELRSSRELPAAIGADGYVKCRSLAEQLVCEANVVLASAGGGRLALTDEARPGALSFCISYGLREARVVTDIGRAVATGHLYGVGARHLCNVELTGADQVEQLILLLIGSGQASAKDNAVPAPGTLGL